nr:hypothetical protein [Tanacetum cinerariifolium]
MKWEDQQGNNHHQQQNQRQKTAKAYVAALAEGRGHAGNLSWCNRCKAHHQPGPCPPRDTTGTNIQEEETSRMKPYPELLARPAHEPYRLPHAG